MTLFCFYFLLYISYRAQLKCPHHPRLQSDTCTEKEKQITANIQPTKAFLIASSTLAHFLHPG